LFKAFGQLTVCLQNAPCRLVTIPK